MKTIFALTVILLFFSPLAAFGQTKDRLKIYAKVLDIPESSFDQEEEPRAHAYIIIKYKVLRVLKGTYAEDEIKVAHGIGSRRKLHVNDEVILEVKPTIEFRETAEILKEAGTDRSEESIADFIFVKFIRHSDR
jgi:hypothetical protein